MRTILTAAIVLALGNGLRADEMDRDTKAKSATAVAKAPVGGSELDQESPDQSHGWRWRRGWGYGGGWGGGFGVSNFPSYSYSSFYTPSYGWGGGWNGGWGGGYSVGYYRPAYYGGWYRGCW